MQWPVRATIRDRETSLVIPQGRGASFDRSYLTLTLLWIALVVAIDPRGEFPLGDDWSYTKMLLNLVDGHRLLPTDATSVPLIGQVIWAAPFTLIAQSAFEAGRLSTLVLGLVGGLATYALVRDAGVPRSGAWLASAALLTNPLWLSLSCTFMTDVPFAAIASCGMLALTRGARTERSIAFALGVVLIVWATVIRQVGLAFAFGAGVAMLLRAPRTPRSVARAVLPLAAGAIALWGYSFLLEHTAGLPSLYYRREIEVIGPVSALGPLARRLAMGWIAAFLYTGLALIPVLPFCRASGAEASSRDRAMTAGAVAAAGILFLALVGLRKMLPVTGNIISVHGLGALTIDGGETLPAAPMAVRGVVTFAAVAAMVAAIRSVAALWRQRADGFLLIASVATIATYVAVVSQIWVYDRYVTALIPLALVAALAAGFRGRPLPRTRSAAVIALVVVQGVVGVLGTRDYFAWNRARWQALADVSQRGIAPGDVDGGLEYNGWSAYDPERPLGFSAGWWRRPQAEFRVAFAPAPGWSVMAQYPYRTSLPPREGRLLVLKRDAGAR